MGTAQLETLLPSPDGPFFLGTPRARYISSQMALLPRDAPVATPRTYRSRLERTREVADAPLLSAETSVDSDEPSPSQTSWLGQVRRWQLYGYSQWIIVRNASDAATTIHRT